jgi:hypothetical protein
MAKYLLAYHGGGAGATEDEQAQVMAKWGEWFGQLGSNLVDGGLPIQATKTVATDQSVSDGGGANPVSGYSIITADSMDGALAAAKMCPVFMGPNASVEVAELMDMPGM